MAYERKTVDEYHIMTNYGCGWETECVEDTLAEAKQRWREYRENTHAAVKIQKRRVAKND